MGNAYSEKGLNLGLRLGPSPWSWKEGTSAGGGRLSPQRHAGGLPSSRQLDRNAQHGLGLKASAPCFKTMIWEPYIRDESHAHLCALHGAPPPDPGTLNLSC